MLIYPVSPSGVWGGEAVEWDPKGPVPSQAILEAPPALSSGETAVWTGVWQMLDADQLVEHEAAYQAMVNPPKTQPGPNLAPLAPWQFWAMLRITGNEQAVRDFVAALPEPAKTVADAQLEFSLEFRRDHPLVENVRTVLNMTVEQLDVLWDQGHALSL